MISLKFGLVAAAITIGSFAITSSANAATCADPAGDASFPSIAGFVTGDDSNSNSGCQIGTDNNDKLNLSGPEPLRVNVDDMFGTSAWTFAGKTFGSTDTGVNIGLSASGSTTGSGMWSVVDNFFTLYGELLLVFKGGNQIPDNYVGYLMTSADGTSGGWSESPFQKLENGSFEPTGISHISAYVRGAPTQEECDDGSFLDDCGPNTSVVPVPAGLPLMLTVIGVGAYMRRKARKSA